MTYKTILQVLGDVRAAFDVTKSDIIIIGKDGLLVSKMSGKALHTPCQALSSILNVPVPPSLLGLWQEYSSLRGAFDFLLGYALSGDFHQEFLCAFICP